MQKTKMLPKSGSKIAAAYFVKQRSFQSIILGFIIVTSRERERQI